MLFIAAIFYCAAAAVALALVRHYRFGDDPMAAIVGATVGTQAGVLLHSRQAGSAPTRRAKCMLGVALALAALLFGLLVQFAGTGFENPAITIGLSTVGSFVFPLVVFGSMWRLLHRSASPRE